MHPVIARAARRPVADNAGDAYGAAPSPGATAALPAELRASAAAGADIRIVNAARPVSPAIAGPAPLADLDHPVGTPRPVAGGGATMPSRLGGIAPWAVEGLSGAHSIILRPKRIKSPQVEPFGGATPGLLRTPPPDVSNGEGCGAYGTVAHYPITPEAFGA